MKWNTLEDIYNSLVNGEHEITVEKEVSDKALFCIDRMLNVSKNKTALH